MPSANSGLRSDLLGSIRGCSWHKYVNAHSKNVMASMRLMVLLQTLSKDMVKLLVRSKRQQKSKTGDHSTCVYTYVLSFFGANLQNIEPITRLATKTIMTVHLLKSQ